MAISADTLQEILVFSSMYTLNLTDYLSYDLISIGYVCMCFVAKSVIHRTKLASGPSLTLLSLVYFNRSTFLQHNLSNYVGKY